MESGKDLVHYNIIAESKREALVTKITKAKFFYPSSTDSANIDDELLLVSYSTRYFRFIANWLADTSLFLKKNALNL